MAANEKVRIKIKGYEHSVVDAAAKKIVEAATQRCESGRSDPASYKQGSSYYPESGSQVQGFS